MRMKKDAGAAASQVLARGDHPWIDACLRCWSSRRHALHVMWSDRLRKSELVSLHVVMTEKARGPFSHGPTAFDHPHSFTRTLALEPERCLLRPCRKKRH